MDTRGVYIKWDNEETYLGRVDEVCEEFPADYDPLGRPMPLSIFFKDVVASLAFATNEVFPDTIKITIR